MVKADEVLHAAEGAALFRPTELYSNQVAPVAKLHSAIISSKLELYQMPINLIAMRVDLLQPSAQVKTLEETQALIEI